MSISRVLRARAIGTRRLPSFPVVLRRTLVDERLLLEADRRELHALGERLAQSTAAVAVLKRQLALEIEQRGDAERELEVARARGARHFATAERFQAAHNAARGLRDESPRPEPTVTANRRRLRDVSSPPAGDHPPRPA